MEKETVEGLHLGTTLIIVAATLSIGVLALWYARMYGTKFFDSTASQNQQVQSLELDALVMAGISDVPVASVYSIVSKEWRAVSEVSVYDITGNLITTATIQGPDWLLTAPLTKLDGTVVTKLSGPEQTLYAQAGGVYGSRVSGRAFVVVTQSESTKTYLLQLKLQD